MVADTHGTQKGCLETIISFAKIAEQYRSAGDYRSALEKLSAALILIPDACSVRAGLMNNIGHIQVVLGWYDEAILSFAESARIYKKTGSPIEQSRQLGNVGSVYRDQKNYKEALVSYQQAIAVLENEDHPVDLADQYGNLAYIQTLTGKSDDAILSYRKAKILYIENKEKNKADMVRKNIDTILSLSREAR
ncbi:tetratricopeptide repeat protein [Desulfosarcina alkanivorans]|nr:tetratricopeptide repeat protein [Desulfosarcina alkanivorans]